jgi:MFS family permease
VSIREASPAQPPASTRTGWYAVLVLSVGLLLAFTDRLIINLVVDPIRRELALSDVQISLLQGAGFALIYAVAGLPCGRLADSMNRRNLIAGGVLVWSLATVACGFAFDFWSFLAARIAVGLGEAALVPAASSLIIDFFSPRQRGAALGVFSLGAVFGSGVALLVGGALLALIDAGKLNFLFSSEKFAAWRQLLVLVGAPGFVLLPFLLLIAEPTRQHSSGLLPIAEVFRHLLANQGAVLRVCLVKAILAAGDYGLISWLPTLLQRNYHLPPLAVGGVLALSVSLSGAIASVAGGAVSDWVVRRWGVPARVVLLLGCYPLTVAGALGIFFARTGQQAAWAMAVWAIGHIVMQEWVPNEMRATTIAVSLTSSALLGIGLGPTLVALVAKHGFGAEAALQPAMGTVSLSAACLALLVVGSPIRRGIAALAASRHSA